MLGVLLTKIGLQLPKPLIFRAVLANSLSSASELVLRQAMYLREEM